MAQFDIEKKKILEFTTGRWGQKYIDIGAKHPIDLSNTYCLYQVGWSGDIYEPQPQFKELFNRIRPNDKFHQVAISNRNGHATLYVDNIDRSYATLEESWIERLNYGWSSLNIKTVDASNLSGIYDFCSIDVEGHESTIINRLDFDKFRVGVFMIESIEHATFKKMWDQWEPSLTNAGYQFIGQFTPLNRFYRHQDYD